MNRDAANRPRVLIAGFQHVFEVARQLNRRGLLGGLYTLTAFGDDGWVSWLTKEFHGRGLRSLRARIVSEIEGSKIHGQVLPEVGAYWRRWLKRDTVGVMAWRNASFQKCIPTAALRSADAIAGFDTSSWILAERARAIGKPFLLEQTIAHPRAFNKVQEDLRLRFPDWGSAFDWKAETFIAQEDMEHALASVILAPSRFVERTLVENGVDRAKIRINPFGSRAIRRVSMDRGRSTDVVRFLFAGTLGARKGLPVLLEAWRKLRPRSATLHIVGSGSVPKMARVASPASISWLGRVPLDSLHSLMAASDVFVLPSFFEGLAMVLVDAASLGLPILATPASGAEEIVREGVNGWLVPEGDSDALADRIEHCICHRDDLELMKRRAIEISQTGRLTWEAYGERWAGVLAEVLGVGREVLAASD